MGQTERPPRGAARSRCRPGPRCLGPEDEQNWKNLSGPGEGTDLSLLSFVWPFIILYCFSFFFLFKQKEYGKSGICKQRT